MQKITSKITTKVANYITKLRGLKHSRNSPGLKIVFSCKLYHKTTWFETVSSISKPSSSIVLQIISQNYVVWNLRLIIAYAIIKASCKLYHKTTWFETYKSQDSAIAALSCKLYHKTTWFETNEISRYNNASHNVANYITKLRGLKRFNIFKNFSALIYVANYITKLRGLKLGDCCCSTRTAFLLQIISQNYVVWNFCLYIE